MGVQRYARRDESIKGAEFALKREKKKSWLKYVLVFGLIFFVCWYERGFLAQAAEKIRKLPNWTIFIIIVLSLTYLVWEGTIIWLLMRQSVKHYSWIQGVRCSFVCSFFRTTTLGSGGGVAQMYEMNRDGLPLARGAGPLVTMLNSQISGDGLPLARGAGLSMVQYIFHKVSITLYGLIGFLCLLFAKDESVSGYTAFLAAGIGLTALITAVLLLVTACPPFSNWGFLIAERLCHGKWQDKRDKMKAQIDSMQEESLRLLKHSPRTAEGIFLCDFAKLTCWYLVPWFVLSADLPVSLWQIVCITAAAQMLAGVIPTPAGLGSLEFVFLMFSTKIVGAAEAGAAMILLRCAVNIIPLVPGALLALTDRRKKKGSRECPAE